MHQIEIKVRFRAGHRLMEPYKGKCNNPHGEGYTAILIFESDKLDMNGMVLDFGEAKRFVQGIVDTYYDHSFMFNSKDWRGDLINVFKKQDYKIYTMSGNPTAENIASDLYWRVKGAYPQLKKVGIVESFDDSIAWYEESEEKKIIDVNVIKGVSELKKNLEKLFTDNNLIPEFNWGEKRCSNCSKLIPGFSEWCTFHFKKRRDFCSQKCFDEFIIKYKEEKNGEEKKVR